jgi:ATP-dependent Clp protease ATP-binding subunit ClpA
VALLAGTTYRGQYEERIRSLVEETTQARDAILFVDELHNLIGQGTAMGVAMDAANMLKPALVRGDFRVIGATTSEEYARWVRGDSALERRFQRVEVHELGAEETLEILRARRERLEAHHHVLIDDSAVVAAVRLTDLFVTDRRRPDRAIDALDEACAHRHAVAGYSPATEQLIRERLRGSAGASTHGPAARRARAAEGAVPGAQEEDEEEIDPFGQLARDGFAALERLGMELESVFAVRSDPPGDASDSGLDRETRAGSPDDERAENPDDAAVANAANGAEPDGGPRARSDETPADVSMASGPSAEPELTRRLRDEGIIVRGQDVARVISVATGRSVRWED